MKNWWIPPLVRIVAALLLPFVVPAVICGIIWALPGQPADIICPPETCSGGQELAERWNLHLGPNHYYRTWLASAIKLDFGRSWRVMQGLPVSELLAEALPNTTKLAFLALIPMLGGAVLAAFDKVKPSWDPAIQGIGFVPAVIIALLFAAGIEITFGPQIPGDESGALRLLCGGMILGIADGALAGAVVGTRSVFTEEIKQRYIGIALLRGESVLANALPNVLPALTGQMRARVLHLLSGTVVVEVVLRISGVGELLWNGTLQQDFGVVLAAAWGFALLSGGLLLAQAAVEIGVAMYVRRSPGAAGA